MSNLNPGGVLNQPLSAGSVSTGSQLTGNQGVGGQQGSNQNIDVVRGHIRAAIEALQSDASDYGGYKERAIDKLNAADGEMQAAIGFVHQPGVQNGSHNPHLSDANLNYVKEHVETAIARLNQDSHDYGGHRAAAVNDLRQADSYINSALSYDGSHDRFNSAGSTNVVPGSRPGFPTSGGTPYARPTGFGGAMQPGSGTTTIGQGNSNDSLADARTHLEWAIDAMQRDLHDYGGYRAKAVASMQAARTEIEQAIAFRTNGHN